MQMKTEEFWTLGKFVRQRLTYLYLRLWTFSWCYVPGFRWRN